VTRKKVTREKIRTCRRRQENGFDKGKKEKGGGEERRGRKELPDGNIQNHLSPQHPALA